jgi:hypothetical protein
MLDLALRADTNSSNRKFKFAADAERRRAILNPTCLVPLGRIWGTGSEKYPVLGQI